MAGASALRGATTNWRDYCFRIFTDCQRGLCKYLETYLYLQIILLVRYYLGLLCPSDDHSSNFQRARLTIDLNFLSNEGLPQNRISLNKAAMYDKSKTTVIITVRVSILQNTGPGTLSTLLYSYFLMQSKTYYLGQ